MDIKEYILNTTKYGEKKEVINEENYFDSSVISSIKNKQFKKAALEYLSNYDSSFKTADVVKDISNVLQDKREELNLSNSESYKFILAIKDVKTRERKELASKRQEETAKDRALRIKSRKEEEEAQRQKDIEAGKKVKKKYKKGNKVEKIGDMDVEVKDGISQTKVKKAANNSAYKIISTTQRWITKLENAKSDSEIKDVVKKILVDYPVSEEYKKDEKIFREFVKKKSSGDPQEIKKLALSHLNNNIQALKDLIVVSLKTTGKKKDVSDEKKEKIIKAKIDRGEAETAEQKRLRLELEKYGPKDPDDPLDRDDSELSKEEIAAGLELAKKYAGSRGIREGMEYILKESYNYKGIHFWENYVFSNLVRGFNEDVKAFGLEEAYNMYVDFYGSETSPIFEHMVNNNHLVEAVSFDSGLLFEGKFDEKVLNEVNIRTVGAAAAKTFVPHSGDPLHGVSTFTKAYATSPKKSFFKLLPGEVPGFLNGLWKKFLQWGGKITKGISAFVKKGYAWASDMVRQGFQFFTTHPISMTIVPAVAVTGSLVLAIKLINKARRKGKMKKMDAKEIALAKEIVRKQQKTIEKLRGEVAA